LLLPSAALHKGRVAGATFTDQRMNGVLLPAFQVCEPVKPGEEKFMT
jgi:hypothetical protein